MEYILCFYTEQQLKPEVRKDTHLAPRSNLPRIESQAQSSLILCSCGDSKNTWLGPQKVRTSFQEQHKCNVGSTKSMAGGD